MNEITDLDVTGLVSKKSGNILGDAHEHFVVAVMMRLGFEVAITELSAGPYDCLIVVYNDFYNQKHDSSKDLLRVQIKTARKSLPLTGGGRAGIDRIYNTDETEDKTYKYTSDIVDLIIGVDKYTLDIYIVPAIYAEEWGSSKSLNLLQPLKNKWNILLNWNSDYINKLKYELPDFKE
ncbi:MAG: hypothetical protein ACOCP8_06725 [archaeon]